MTYTAQQLADFLINNDMEIQIVRRDLTSIVEFLDAEGIQADMQTVEKAVEIANADPMIEMYYARFA